MFPSPLKTRWQPLRGGLVNLFQYEDQIFRYGNGRLLLRGNNGSGKSRVLALQLPFLFDGDLSPYRVEPDRDPAKRMEWHLLMNRHERRTGYTWLEFGRRDEDGTEHFVTIGCGMEARKGGGSPNRWFFISPDRVGEDLHLVQNRIPLGKSQLGAHFQELGRGDIYEKSAEYRDAVDHALFKLGRERYRPLIDLLIQLRQPQLMRDMKENVLSDALSEALPPVPENLIAQVAESFQSLDTDRQQTQNHREMRDTVEAFHEGYRQYLAVAVRRLCEVVRHGHSQFEARTKEVRDIEEKLEENAGKLANAESAREQAATLLTRFHGEVETLKSSPEMKSAQELEEAARRETELAREEDALKKFSEKASEQSSKDRAEVGERGQRLTENEAATGEIHGKVGELHSRLAPPSTSFFDWKTAELETERKDLNRLLDERRRAVKHLETQNRKIHEMLVLLKQEKKSCSEKREAVAESEDSLRKLRGEIESEIEGFGSRIRQWENSLAQLHAEAFSRGRDWSSELAEWSEERQPVPPVPHTRGDGRGQFEGAPFWQLFEFREHVPDSEHAGWEAALESSGILDSWVFPDGRISGDFQNDTAVFSGNPATGPSLLDILKPARDSEILRKILSQIGSQAGTGNCWVSAGGQWVNGPQAGHWQKNEASYLGQRARESARQRRIVVLDKELAELEEIAAGLAGELSEIANRQERLRNEIEAAPNLSVIEGLLNRSDLQEENLATAKSKLLESEQAVIAAESRHSESVASRDQDAADFHLQEWREPDRLAEFSSLLNGYETTAVRLWAAWEKTTESIRELQSAKERYEASEARAAEANRNFQTKHEAAEHARAKAATLRANIGATVEEVLARLADAEGNARKAETAKQEADDKIRHAEIANASLSEKKENAFERRSSAEASRNTAVSRMEVFAGARIFAELDPEWQPERPAFSATAAVELARRLEQELKGSSLEDAVWQKLQAEITQNFNEFTDQLVAHGLNSAISVIDESSVHLVTCDFQGQARSIQDLAGLLETELANRTRIFEEREREIIENHLIGEAAATLQVCIRNGENWVRDVNGELENVKTSSGIQLKFEWSASDPDDAEFADVRRIFLKTSAAWKPEERQRLGGFLQKRIRQSQEENDTITWGEHLTRALDYRAWHRFGIMLKSPSDQGWKRLTKRTFGTGSGGEKAMTLTLPQFAAAAAHYRSAHKHAPRLILPDEVFVGIDAEARPQLMGLLETFDLDYVMTSEREWGTYPTVSALAIYQLATRPDFQAVAVTRWVWNGREKLQDKDG